ncbi:SELENBP1-like protein [Aphelenchoides fujianensis]|nr:SELENBP1-like protein [Aphelenchoides fujianensis]
MTADEKVAVETTEMPAETNGGSTASTVEIADSNQDCCASSGIPYATPKDACKGPREKILFVTCPNVAEPRGPDALVSVDVDPDSETYCQVLSKLDFPHIGDEVHHSGWNACASCFGKAGTVEPEELKAMNVSFPHTSHCLADGTIMISTLGDANGNNRGEFILLDGTTFELKGRRGRDDFNPEFHYDYWYQPRQNVMMSSEWGNPNFLSTGFNPAHGITETKSTCLIGTRGSTFKRLSSKERPDSCPRDLRFLHDPDQKHAFVGAALGSAIYHLYQPEEGGEYKQRLAATVTSKWVKDWAMTDMPALITDIIISMNDRYMYISGWLHGEIRQYDISDPFDFKLTGQLIIGGLLHRNSGVTVLEDDFPEYDQTEVKGRKIDGGPQMMQLSLDGKRLYVTTSLYTVWDQQFYPALMKNGAVMLLVDVDTEKGGLKLNEDFLIDFGKLPGGPYAGHEMRYPNGDCTTDVWL